MGRLAAMLCALMISLAVLSGGGAEMVNPEQMPETEGLPELLRFADGGEVKTPEDWERRREELLDLYSEYMYGYMPERTRETVTWTAEAAPELDGTLLTVMILLMMLGLLTLFSATDYKALQRMSELLRELKI